SPRRSRPASSRPRAPRTGRRRRCSTPRSCPRRRRTSRPRSSPRRRTPARRTGRSAARARRRRPWRARRRRPKLLEFQRKQRDAERFRRANSKGTRKARTPRPRRSTLPGAFAVPPGKKITAARERSPAALLALVLLLEPLLQRGEVLEQRASVHVALAGHGLER